MVFARKLALTNIVSPFVISCRIQLGSPFLVEQAWRVVQQKPSSGMLPGPRTWILLEELQLVSIIQLMRSFVQLLLLEIWGARLITCQEW